MSRETKRALGLITYGVVLLMALMHLQKVTGAAKVFVGYFKPVIYGIAIAYVLNLIMAPVEERWLAGLWRRSRLLRKGKRAISLTLTLLIVAVALTALGWFIFPEVGRNISNLAASFPQYTASTMDYLNSLFARLSADNDIVRTIQEQWQQILQALTTIAGGILNNAAPWLVQTAGTIGSGIMNFFLGLVFAVYILAAKDTLACLAGNAMSAYLPARYGQKIRYVFEKVDRAFSSFISGQLIEAVILGSLCTIGMILLKLPYAVLIGTIVGITGLVPILGAYIGTIPSVFLIFIISPFKALVFIIFILILQQVETNFIYPKVVGGSIGLGGLWVMMALIVGGNIFGFAGMLLGIPVTAVLYALLQESIDRRLKEKGIKPAEPPGDIPKAKPPKKAKKKK